MNIVTDFRFQLDKYKIIKAVQSYCKTPPFEELSKIYDKLLFTLRENSKPLGLYKIEDKPESFRLGILNECSFVIYCLVTIGSNSNEQVNDLFNEGKFYEAILLDTMASFYLFDISSQLFDEICEQSHKKGLGLTHKIAPGDGEIGLEFQKEIVNKFEEEDIHNIKVINGCMLYPSKSMSYIYGADKNIAFNQNDHCCENCHNTSCSMRNVTVKDSNIFFKKIDCA